jgi:EAL domain-containing protein (putative c-di-GMP-specific phosphodiesterase class I)
VEKAWFLEGVATDGSRVTHPLLNLPFRVGRDPANDLAVDARGLSRQHAEFMAGPKGELVLRDLDSTNGTYVNRERIQLSRVLSENDVLHFGNAEYRLGIESATRMALPPDDGERTLIVPAGKALSQHFVRHEKEFMELLRGQGLTTAMQPIVDAHTGALFAYELLGRCSHPGLPNSPAHLFSLAAQLGREAELSAAFRSHGINAVAPRLHGAKLFINSHPHETFEDSFFQMLTTWRDGPDAPQLVVEVHETAVMEVARMRELAARLETIGVLFAYDDFGAGQARLNELGDVPPHFVKFDMGLLQGLHEASDRKQKMVRDLVKLVLDLGSVPLAEGIELEEEAALCRQMGFQLIQGYLTGRPMPVDQV